MVPMKVKPSFNNMDINGMMNNKFNYLPKTVNWYGSNTRESLAKDLSQSIGQLLSQSINHDGRASLAVSGGRTPVLVFEALSEFDLDWSKVDLALVDERWVDASHEDSNELLVRQHLIKNKASEVNFTPIKNNAKTIKDSQILCQKSFQKIKQPFDVVVLGMGTDGHTASLFPCAEELNDAMNPNNSEGYAVTSPKTAPYERISLTYKEINSAINIILHLNGSHKLKVLELAMSHKDAEKMPIYAFLEDPINIYWSP